MLLKAAVLTFFLIFPLLFLPIRITEAQGYHFINVVVDELYYLRGETATIYIWSNDSTTYNIRIIDPSGQVPWQRQRTTNENGMDVINLPIPLDFPTGYCRVQAWIPGEVVSESCVTILYTSGYSSTTFPYEVEHMTINYSIVGRGFTATSADGNITIRYPKLPISFTVNAYYNNMSFVERLQNIELGIYMDISYIFIHGGMKIRINGSIPSPTSYSFEFTSPRELKRRFDELRDGWLVFDWSDLRKAAQQFSYSNGVLTVDIPQSFVIDPYVFEDGFESGNFSAWTGTTNSPTVNTTAPHQGTYHSLMNAQEDCYKTFTAASEMYFRFYVRWDVQPPYATAWCELGLLAKYGTGLLAGVRIDKSGEGDIIWQLRYRNNSNPETSASDMMKNPALDTWQCVELYVKEGDGTGEAKIYINGTELSDVSKTGLIQALEPNSVYLNWVHGANSIVVLHDSAVVDTSYIGLLGGDSTAPTYASISTNSTHAGNVASFNAQWDDETDLTTTGGYIFGTNNTGSWANETYSTFTSTPQWANVSKTLNSTVGQVVGYRWWANDTAGNWNSSMAIQTLTTTDTTVPTSANENSNATIAGSVCLFSTEWTNLALSGHIFSTNNTGSWTNDTWTDDWAGTPITGWSNETKTLNSTVSTIVGWRIYTNDTSDNWGDTGINTLTTTGLSITVQVRDADGTNVPRVVTVKVTLPNSTTATLTTGATGSISFTTGVGSHTVAIWWGTHLIYSDSVSITVATTVNCDSKIDRVGSGSNYALVSLNNTALTTEVLVSTEEILYPTVVGTGDIQIKVDGANWVHAEELQSVTVGSSESTSTHPTWSWDSSNKILAFTCSFSVKDIRLKWGVPSSDGNGGYTPYTPVVPPLDLIPSEDAEDGTVAPGIPDSYVTTGGFKLPVVDTTVVAVAIIGIVCVIYVASKYTDTLGPVADIWDKKRTKPRKKVKWKRK